MDIVPVRCRIPEHLDRMRTTQVEFAERIGISRQQLNDYIKLRYVMKLPLAMRIAHEFKVHIDDLYDWEWRGE